MKFVRASATFMSFASLLSIGFGQLSRISLFGQQRNVYVFEAIVIINLITLVCLYGLKPFKQLTNRSLLPLIFVSYLGLTLIVTFVRFSPFQNLVAFLYLIRLSVYILDFYYLSFHFTIKGQGEMLRSAGIPLFSGFLALTSVIQYFWFSDLSGWFSQGWDLHYKRIFGVFLDPPMTAAIVILAIIYIVHHLTTCKTPYILNISMKVLAIFLFGILLLTFSRGAYLAFLFIAVIYFLKAKKWLILIGFISVFAVGIYLIPKPSGEGVNLMRTFSIYARLANYEDGFDMWRNNMFLGVGYNHIRYAKSVQTVSPSKTEFVYDHAGASFHSSFLTILASAGIAGLALFVGVLLYFASLNSFGWYAVIALSVMSLFDNVILYPFVLVLFIIMLTLTLQSARQSSLR
ncbi:O-antigen ligase family protein [Candidatus Roizmanbacteria bacterium]|nr:O-antigen ligase family protein [Candidatus Roizmanbacteria bacterium]